MNAQNGVRGNPHYDHARTQLYSLYDDNKEKFTISEVRKRLTAAFLRIGDGRERSNTLANYTNIKKKNKFAQSKPDWHKTATCYGCGQKGHVKKDCRHRQELSEEEDDDKKYKASLAQKANAKEDDKEH